MMKMRLSMLLLCGCLMFEHVCWATKTYQVTLEKPVFAVKKEVFKKLSDEKKKELKKLATRLIVGVSDKDDDPENSVAFNPTQFDQERSTLYLGAESAEPQEAALVSARLTRQSDNTPVVAIFPLAPKEARVNGEDKKPNPLFDQKIGHRTRDHTDERSFGNSSDAEAQKKGAPDMVVGA